MGSSDSYYYPVSVLCHLPCFSFLRSFSCCPPPLFSQPASSASRALLAFSVGCFLSACGLSPTRVFFFRFGEFFDSLSPGCPPPPPCPLFHFFCFLPYQSPPPLLFPPSQISPFFFFRLWCTATAHSRFCCNRMEMRRELSPPPPPWSVPHLCLCFLRLFVLGPCFENGCFTWLFFCVSFGPIALLMKTQDFLTGSRYARRSPPLWSPCKLGGFTTPCHFGLFYLVDPAYALEVLHARVWDPSTVWPSFPRFFYTLPIPAMPHLINFWAEGVV